MAGSLAVELICASRTCQNKFIPTGHRRKYCTAACSKRENQRKYAEAHPENVRQSQKAWAEANREHLREYHRENQRAWRSANLEKERERGREYARKWRAEHREQFLATQRAYRKTNHHELIEKRRERDGSISREAYLRLASSESLKAAWRPDDWKDRPVDWQTIATLILTHPGISNQELGFYLDKARIGSRPHGSTWQAALSSTQNNAATQLISRVRRWVKQPGRKRIPADS